MRNRSRGCWKIEGRSLHIGLTKVPGSKPISFGNWLFITSFARDFIDGCAGLLGLKFCVR